MEPYGTLQASGRRRPFFERPAARRLATMKGTCSCGSPFLRLFDDLGCVECGHQCCWSCAVVIESAAYCVRCADLLVEVSQSFAEGVVRCSA